MKGAFDNPDTDQTEEQKIHKLKEGNQECTRYYAEFLTHVTIWEWDERTKISFFKKRLDEELQKLLLINVNPLDTLPKYLSITIELDNNLQINKQKRYTTSRTNNGGFSQPTPSTTTSSHSGPMDLSPTRHANYQTKFNSQK